MYPAAFRYYRAATLEEAASVLAQAGDEARPLAGGQSLIPLMKLRFARPSLLVDLNSIPGLSSIKSEQGVARIGALARHGQVAESELSRLTPILHDCASGIADTQVRSRGIVGRSRSFRRLGSGTAGVVGGSAHSKFQTAEDDRARRFYKGCLHNCSGERGTGARDRRQNSW